MTRWAAIIALCLMAVPIALYTGVFPVAAVETWKWQSSAASAGGIKCTSYGECLDVLSTESDIDYDGISGPLDQSEAGDVTAGSFGIFSYAASNVPSLVRVVTAG